MTYTLDDLDPRTPVLVGGGQSAEQLNAPDYRALSPVELAAEAAQRALADTGSRPGRSSGGRRYRRRRPPVRDVDAAGGSP